MWQNSTKPLIVKGFYLLRISDDYCFRRAAQGQLSQREKCCNSFESYGKISSSSKRNKSVCRWVFWKKSQDFSKFAVKSPCQGLFIVKLQHVMAYKRLLGQLSQKRDTYMEALTQLLSVNFEKKYEHDC